MDRHQLDGRNAQRLQVRDLLDQPQVSSRVFCAARFVFRKAADVRLVNDRLGNAVPQVTVPSPIEVVIDHHALGWANDAVLGQLEASGQGLGIRIDQASLTVEPLSVLWVEGPVRLKVIKLAGADSWDEDAPDVSPAIRFALKGDNFRRLAVLDVVV